MSIAHRLQAHLHLVIGALVGTVAALVAPDIHSVLDRCLLGWNVAAWTYLVWTGLAMRRADLPRVKRVAEAQAESAGTVLAIVAVAALASFGAAVIQLSAAKAAGPGQALPHVAFTLSTLVASWLLVPTLFTLNYASQYHVRDRDGSGFKFPDASADFEPNYLDFAYFSFTIAVALQTADVVITNRAVRRLVLMQSVLSFVFNTTVLAFTINMAASLL